MPSDQEDLWNGICGRVWVESQDLIDQVFEPISSALAVEVAASGAKNVLDVGCGTGATTLAAARRLTIGGSVTGVDISAPMLKRARQDAEREGLPASFVLADAQTHHFGDAGFDLLISRFGVMFFDDPVEAFANLKSATEGGGSLQAIVWRSAEENPFMTTAESAARPLLPDLSSSTPDAPGPFAFADAERTRALLTEAGWDEISIEPADFECEFPEERLNEWLTRLGPVARAIADADEATRAAVMEVVRPAFEHFVDWNTVRFTAACWRLGARA